MRKRCIDQEPAFVLHTRAYRDTSLLVDFLTLNHGVVSNLAKGIRQAKNRSNGLLQPFNRLLVSWQGRHELKTMTDIEQSIPVCLLKGRALFSGFYINELLLRLIHKDDGHPELFRHYEQLIQHLQTVQDIEPLLRDFEIKLLVELGYGINFQYDSNGEVYDDDGLYYFDAGSGFEHLLYGVNSERRPFCFSGSEIINIGSNNYHNRQIRQSAKRLMRLAYQPLLGEKPLKSRDFFSVNHSGQS